MENMEKKTYAKITEKKFQCIKILLASGSTWKEIGEYMECSQGTIGRIKAAESYQEYLNTMAAAQRAQKAKKRAMAAAAAEAAKAVGAVPASSLPSAQEPKQETVQVVEHRQTVTVQATHYMEQQLRTMNETLKLISNKLAFIVEELTGKEVDDT